MKRFLSILLSVIMIFGVMTVAVSAEDALTFDLVTEVFAYGQDVTGLVIDTESEVAAANIDNQTFAVTAVATMANGNEAFNGIRNITDVYVNNTGEYGVSEESGRYIVIELEHGFTVAGATTLYYSGRNYYLDLDYTVTQTKTIGEATYNYVQGETKNLIVDDFALVEYEDTSFRAYIPENAENLPVVLWNHGAGETFATTNEGVQITANMGGVGFVKNAPEACIVIAPQRGNGTNYSQEKIISYIEGLIAEGKADADRVYVTGCSAGGGETLNYIKNYRDFFAAAAPICPAGSFTDEQAAEAAALPMLFVHAVNDPTINVSRTRNTIAQLQQYNPNGLVYNEYENVIGDDGVEYPNGHWSWIRLLDNQDGMIDWMFSHVRGVVASEIITEVAPHGQEVTAVIIDNGRSVDGSTIDADTFTVSATNYSPLDGSVAYDGVRNVVNAYVNDSKELGDVAETGRYIVLELEHGFTVDGSTTLIYRSFNYPLDLNYFVDQNKSFKLIGGQDVEEGNYAVTGRTNLIVDDFASGTSEGGLNYRFFTPEKAEGEEYPLVLWLHGAGERASSVSDNNSAQILANQGGVAWALPENQAKHPCYVLAPQSPGSWDTDLVIALVKEIIEANPDIDTDRVYIAGCSMGGMGTWNTILKDNSLFAAAITCPGGSNADAETMIEAGIVDFPLWMVQTGNDTLAATEAAYNTLTALGANVKWTHFEAGGNNYPNDHWSWVPTLSNFYSEEYGTYIHDWLFRQKRDAKEFEIITEVFAYGQDVTGLVIDTRDTVAAADIDKETFEVTAANYRANGAQAFSGTRNITNVYVNNSGNYGDSEENGRYIVIELEHGFTVAGATTLYYSGRNYYLDLNYAINQTKPIGDKTLDFVQGQKRNLIVDDFDIVNYEDTFFRVYIPENAEGPLPVVIWNHGAGETYAGTNEGVQITANMGGVGWVKNAPEACIVIAPQRGTGTNFTNKKVISYIEELVEAGLADCSRVYVSGCSAGGGQTLSFLREYADVFAAAIPICPAGSLNAEQAAEVADLPMILVHAENDTTIRVQQSRNLAALIEQQNPYDFTYNEYPNVTGSDGVVYPNGHWSWIMVLDNTDNMMDWMFAQKKAIVTDYTTTAEEDGEITITVNARNDVIGFQLFNEAGKSITIKKAAKVADESGRLTWTITTSVGTAGSRELSLIPVSVSSGKHPAEILNIEVSQRANANDIIDAEFDVRAAAVNTPVGLEVVSGKAVKVVNVTNENGGKMGKTLVSKVVNDGIATWNYSMRVGTAGDRTFTVSEPNGSSVTADIIIVK